MARLVLLPGVDGTDAFFRPFVECRPPGVNVKTLEYERFEARSYEALSEHIRAALPDDDFFLLGWSFSGPLVLMLAARLPRLRGIILVASFACRPVRYLHPWLKVLARPSLFSLYPMASMGQAFLQGYSTPELRALQSEAFSRTSPASLAARARMLFEVDVRSELRSCHVPILYARAQDDRLIDREHAQTIVTEAPRATLVDVPGPHLCLATHPRDAWTAIEPFLATRIPADAWRSSSPRPSLEDLCRMEGCFRFSGYSEEHFIREEVSPYYFMILRCRRHGRLFLSDVQGGVGMYDRLILVERREGESNFDLWNRYHNMGNDLLGRLGICRIGGVPAE